MANAIRAAKPGDARAIRDIYAPYVLDNVTSFETEVPDEAAMQTRIADIQQQLPWLVYEEDGNVLGYAYASPYRVRKAYQWCVEVTVYLHESAHRRGVGRALYESLIVILRAQGYTNAYGVITVPNPASIGLHEAVGFVPIGVFHKVGFKLGAWHDVAWLELRLADPITPQPDLLSFDDVFTAPDVQAQIDAHTRAIRVK